MQSICFMFIIVEISMDEEDFFDNQIRILLKGASFSVKCSVLESASTSCTSKLSNDHRFLLFDVQDKNVSIDPIELMLIESFQVSHPGGICHTNLT